MKDGTGLFDVLFELLSQGIDAVEALLAAQKLDELNPHDLTIEIAIEVEHMRLCLLYTSPSPRDATLSRMPSSA